MMENEIVLYYHAHDYLRAGKNPLKIASIRIIRDQEGALKPINARHLKRPMTDFIDWRIAAGLEIGSTVEAVLYRMLDNVRLSETILGGIRELLETTAWTLDGMPPAWRE
jgi:hypothetical protein